MFRLLGLLGGLALGTDLGTGAPLDESLRRCLVATRLARELRCENEQVRDVVYASLLQHLGCTAYSHETGRVWGDDVRFVRLAFRTDWADRKDVWRTWVGGLAEASGRSRAGVAVTAMTSGRKGARDGPVSTCEVAREAARQLELPRSLQQALSLGLTAWDGSGYPEVSGEAIPLPVRIVHVASLAVLITAAEGRHAALDAVRQRAGRALDPMVAQVFLEQGSDWLAELAEGDPYEAVLDAEPDPVALVDDEHLEQVARVFGQLADLKSPWLHGHSAAVAELAGRAATAMQMDPLQVRLLRVAGHLHDLGRVGVPSRVWDQAEPSRSELEQARLHAYHSERIIARVPALADAALIAGRHHERLDGTGYHRGVGGAQLSTPARVLAAADAYRELVEDRAGRPGLGSAEAARRLREEVRAGTLDGDAVTAVLHAAGLRPGGRRVRTAGLTERQVQVLTLIAQGCSNREVARSLGISPRTAEHHVQDVYQRIGRSTRAGAALFAMEHGLVGEDG